ncbi:MAG: OprO/OprP family phosphate-selective porin [Planctomycetaceae bacterium]|nr:OprO/OprP family phosphate-selective porin [Planctomycetaceae bacterium]
MHHCLARPLPSPIAARQHPLAWLACVCLLLPAAAVRADDAAPGRLEELEEAYVATPDTAPVTQGFASLELSDPDVILAQKIQDPAIETVDEMTRRGAAGGSKSGGNVGQWWDSIRDPAIRTVDEQTRGPTKKEEKKWYDRINIRGYTQFRINSVLWNDESQAPPYHPADRSIGPFNEFFIRRCRLIFSGDLSDRLYFYIQPDFASGVPGARDGAINYAQLRDCYGDVYLTENKVNRVRVGLSKIPFGWDNMQSSSNRLPLDRSDPINSAINGERGMGVFYYWTPEEAQDLYKEVLDEGLKGSGNYGVFGIGVYNGQGVSRADANSNMHFVMRLEMPWKTESGQIMEAGVQAYTGNYSPYLAPIETAFGEVVPVVDPANGVLDQRIGGTFVYYPQPFGITAEWSVGDGPQLTDLDQPQPVIVSRPLNGGYVLLNYKIDSKKYGTIFPYFRWQQYHGGYLWERNSPDTFLNEFDLGVEWQIQPQMELTMEYDFVNRTNTGSNAKIVDANYAQFRGDLLRFQFQINY